MKIQLIVTYLLLFNILQGQNLENVNSEHNDSIHLLEVMEPIMKNVLSEIIIGENIENHNPDFQQECLNRLKNIYSDEGIETLKNNVPKNYKMPFKSQNEILRELIEFTRDSLNPELQKIQNKVYSQLSKEEEKQLPELKEQYRNTINLHFEQKMKELLINVEFDEKVKREKMIKLELEHELSIITPNLKAVWKKNSQEYQMINELSKKYDFVIKNSKIDYFELVKDRFKISIGRLGNFASAIMGVVENEEKIESLITKEVLLIN